MKLTLLSLFLLVTSSAAFGQIGFGLQAGTLGPGVTAGMSISPKLTVRAGFNYLPVSYSDQTDEFDIAIAYDAEATLSSASVLADFHPFGGGFRLTGGAFLNMTEGNATVLPTEPYELNENKTFTVERVGSLSATVGYQSSVAPYAGFGFGRVIRQGFGFNVDFGVLYTGSPKIEMSGDGLIAPTALQAERLQEGVKSFQFYPVFSIGLGFGF